MEKYELNKYKVAVITLSDKGFRGERSDESGNVIEEIISDRGHILVERILLPDEYEEIVFNLKRLSDEIQVDLILTTGGTGFSDRDVTPEATLEVATKNAMGIVEAMRWYSISITKRAMLSRAVSVIRNKTLIVNLPGSPKAVREELEFAISSIEHGLEILAGDVSECAR
ncbi:MAG: MogA/MoaB family molybdenum cofactor biosynthesis protein [Clostridioides sp.]|nr:MogA/MoaB family molybdenum cofactor biosynthesis protein [Clostridioides sp.]